MIKTTRVLAMGCTSWWAGCVSLSPQGTFREVQTAVSERIDRRVEWRQAGDADTALDGEIHDLLESTLTADEAVQIALLNNRNLQAIYEELGIARADLVEAGLLKNPVFEAQYRLPGRPANPFEIHVVEDFIDVFFIPLRQKIAATAQEAAKFRVANAVLELAAETRRAFYHLQGAEQLTDMRETTVEATEASAMLAQRQREAGNISDLDLQNEKALFEQSKVDLALAEIEALDQRERLNELMGLWGPQAAAWSVDPRLPEPPPDEIAPAGLESLAASQRLDLLGARQQIESLAQSVGLTQYSALFPALDVGGHIEREPEGVATWGPSVGLVLPIFNQGQPAVARAAARLRQAQQRYFALAVEMRSQVRSAVGSPGTELEFAL